MKYKLIVSDLDGTALRSDRTASNRTVKAIRDYQAAGGRFIICTGRMFESVIKVAPQLGLDELNVPICAMDGAIIKESITHKVIHLSAMPYEQTAAFAKQCEELGCYFQVYSQDKLFVREENEINREYCNLTKVKMNVVGKLSDYILANKLECVKVLIADDQADSYIDCFKDRYDQIQFFLSSATYLDGASVNAGKGNALKRVAELFGIDIANTVAIGDSMNDISMVKEAALGIAVANADDRLMKVADFVAPSNDEDGLAYVIEKAISDQLP